MVFYKYSSSETRFRFSKKQYHKTFKEKLLSLFMINNRSKTIPGNLFKGFRRWFSGIALAGVISLQGCGGPGPIESDPDPKPQPSISLTANLVRDTDITLNADLKNLDQANLSVTRNGASVPRMSRLLSDGFSETFPNQRKGEYCFIGSGGGVSSNQECVAVPTYLAELDSDGLNFDFRQDSSITTSLEGRFSDRNTEDKPVLRNVRSLNGKVTLTVLDDYKFMIEGLEGNSGQYQFEVEFGSDGEETVTETFTGNIEPLVLARISGQIQNNRTDFGESSQMNVYDGSVTQENFLGHISTSDGTFDFQLNDEVEGPLILRTRLDQNSYVMTISIPVADISGLVTRSHPKDQPYDLRLHMEEMNPGFFKWDLITLNGVEIIDNDPLGRGSLTSAEQSSTETTFRANMECYTGNHPAVRDFYIQKDTVGSERHYSLTGNGLELERDWIFITRDTAMTFGGFTNNLVGGEGDIYNSVIKLNQITPRIVSAEQGHTFITANNRHAQTLQSPTTIMRAEGPYLSSSPGLADCEAGTVLYEDTYTAGSSYDNILGEPSTFNTSLSGTPGITIIWN